MSLLPSTRTFGELSRAVQRAFGDESGVQLEDQDIIDFANQGLTEIVAENAILKTRGQITTTPGQREYTFPDIKIARIEFLHHDKVLLPAVPFQDAQERLLEIDRNQDAEGTPQWWYSYGDTFWLWPTPVDSKTVEVFFVRYPDTLSGDLEQTLGVPDKWFNPLRDYILKQAYEMDQDWEAAGVKNQQFQQALQSQAEEESQSQFGEFPTIREV